MKHILGLLSLFLISIMGSCSICTSTSFFTREIPKATSPVIPTFSLVVSPTSTLTPIPTSTPISTSTPSLLTCEIFPSVEVSYDPELWLFVPETVRFNEAKGVDEHFPATLQFLNDENCYLHENFGRGYPSDWSVKEKSLILGESNIIRKRFLNGENKHMFSVYHFDEVYIYLSSTDDWKSCTIAAEEVLDTYHIALSP